MKKFILSGIAFLFLLANHYRAVAQTPDPGLMGTHSVVKAEYDLGDTYYPSSLGIPYFSWAMECRGSVHYPSDLGSGPFPVLIWLHGRHSTCYQGTSASSSWPCPSGWTPIPSYAGYDYAARTMASHGYIVISISANSINAHDAGSGDQGMTARGYLMQYHLDLWKGWNTTDSTGPFGSMFLGKLDLNNVGTMGHSRGGEGAIYNAEYNRTLGSPYGIKAVLTLAPVDFHRHVLNNTALMNIAPYCDGDVNDLQGVHFYDNARYADTTDEMGKHLVLVMGANHNYFNTIWTQPFPGGGDDWLYTGGATTAYCGEGAVGTGRIDSIHQKNVYNAYAAAFYRYYLGHETAFAPILETDDIQPPASIGLDTTKLFVSNHPGRTLRLDINRSDSTTDLTFNTLHGPVTTSGLTGPSVCDGGGGMPSCGISGTQAKVPHAGLSGAGLGATKLTWSSMTNYYQNEIPNAYKDFTGYKALQFRATVNYAASPSGTHLDFTVQLIDSLGAIDSVHVQDYSAAMFFQPGTLGSDLPKACFNTIRVPLDSFSGVNMTKIKYIKFLFNRDPAGAIAVSDLQLVSLPCGKFNANYTHTPVTGATVAFTSTTTANYGDTLSYLWNFGDPTTGTADTSTLQNPTHAFSVGGGTSYSPCLYVSIKRRNGTICLDTFCATFTVGTPAIVKLQTTRPAITIIPNPARDYLQINGADKTDVLKLYNLYGQEVFSAVITQPIIGLPQNLANGLYTAVVVSPGGNYYQKVLINK